MEREIDQEYLNKLGKFFYKIFAKYLLFLIYQFYIKFLIFNLFLIYLFYQSRMRNLIKLITKLITLNC